MRRSNTLITIFIIIVICALLNLPSIPLTGKVFSTDIDRTIHPLEIHLNLAGKGIHAAWPLKLGLDLSGGTHLVLEANMSSVIPENRDAAFASARDVVERRVNLYGLTEPLIQQARSGDSYRIIVEIPGISDASEAVALIGKTAQLTFHESASDSAKIATPSSLMQLFPVKTSLSGSQLKKSEVVFNQSTGKPQVSLEFNDEGAKLFESITTRNVGKSVAIFLDDQLLSAPRVNEPIAGGHAVISGEFGVEEAKRLSISLNAGALPVPLSIIEQRNIGATLGQESVRKSLLAAGIGLAVVALFMIVNYRMLGVVAVAALFGYTLVSLALFRIIPVTLTLAGIAGFILSIGMAVDANILIFERIREEIRWGKSFSSALRLGFDRAFPSIRDSNISTLITCAILYGFGTSIVRGFALTLAVGVMVSFFSAVFITRTFIRLMYKEA